MQVGDTIWCATYGGWGYITGFEGTTAVARLYCGMNVEFEEGTWQVGQTSYWYVTGRARA